MSDKLYPIIERLKCIYNGRDFSGQMTVNMPTALMLEAAEEIRRLKDDNQYYKEAEGLLLDEIIRLSGENAIRDTEDTASKYRMHYAEGKITGRVEAYEECQDLIAKTAVRHDCTKCGRNHFKDAIQTHFKLTVRLAG